jgi:uncharacterized membrane protein
MVLDIPAGSPWVIRAAAALILSLHITGGAVGVVSGSAAFLFRKGSRLHRRAGTWFVVAMLTMSGIGATVAPFLPDRPSSLAGSLTFYLVLTSWFTVRRKVGGVGLIEMGALLFSIVLTATGLHLGLLAMHSPGGLLDGEPYQAPFVFAGIAALSAVGDLKLLLRRGISGARRLTRHLWRNGVAFLIAAFSFFLGQQQVFPDFLRGSFLLFVPEVVIVGLILFWLIRVRIFAPDGMDVANAASALLDTSRQS